jgi:hypothetical protein
MRRGLELRVRALEAAVPDEAEVRKSPFPQWLLDAWQEGGQQLDRSDGDTLWQDQPGQRQPGGEPGSESQSRHALHPDLGHASEHLRRGQLPAKGKIRDDSVSQLQGPLVSGIQEA